MLNFLVDNTQLILDPQTKIRYELNSSYFNEEAIPAGVIWHFDVPAADNEETFKYSNYIIVAKKFRIYNCVIKLHSYPIGSGKLVVSLSNAKIFRVQVTLNSFAIDFENVKLNEAGYVAERIGGEPHSQANVLQHAKDVNAGTVERDYRFPMVYAPEFYEDDANDTWAGYINSYSNDAFVSNDADIGNKNSMVPFPKFFDVFERILNDNYYTIKGSLFEHPELQKLLLFSNQTIDNFGLVYKAVSGIKSRQVIWNGFDLVKFGWMEGNELFEDEQECMFGNKYVTKVDGDYNVHAKVYNISWVNEYDGVKTYKPTTSTVAVYVDGVQTRSATASMYSDSDSPLLTELNVTIPLLADQEVDIRIKIRNPNGYTTDGSVYETSILTISKDGENGVNTYQSSLNLKDHIPAENVTSVLNSIRNAFFGAVFINDEYNQVELELLKDVLKNRYVVDLSEHVVYQSQEITPSEPKKVVMEWATREDVSTKSESKLISGYNEIADIPPPLRKAYALAGIANAVYVYSQEQGESQPSWKYEGHNFRKYESAVSGLEMIPEIGFGPLPAIDNGMIYPYTSMTANSHIMPDEDNDAGMQLLFWHGVDTRPIALPGNRMEGDMKLGDLSLEFSGDDGVISQFGSEWIDFVSGAEEFKVMLTNIDLFKLVEIQDLFLPNRREDHPRWVYLKNVRALPKQFTAIFDIKGNILDSEIVLCKKGE